MDPASRTGARCFPSVLSASPTAARCGWPVLSVTALRRSGGGLGVHGGKAVAVGSRRGAGGSVLAVLAVRVHPLGG